MHFPQANNFFQNRKAPRWTAIQQNKINDLLNYKLKEDYILIQLNNLFKIMSMLSTYLASSELIPTKSWDTRFDSSSAKSN